jgi:hypothetical protein
MPIPRGIWCAYAKVWCTEPVGTCPLCLGLPPEYEGDEPYEEEEIDQTCAN